MASRTDCDAGGDVSVPVLYKRNSADSLEKFAMRIEEMFRHGKDQGPFALQRQVCRLMASKDLKVSAMMTAKWVEWRFGRAKETLKVEGRIEHVNTNISDEQLAEADRLIESALEVLGDKG
jgi:hypothetical protein